jgi:hypothetical protein
MWRCARSTLCADSYANTSDGDVVIDLLSNGKTRGNTSSGSVLVKDSGVLKGIRSNPKNWYANLHTSQFADGAVRGQLKSGGRW